MKNILTTSSNSTSVNIALLTTRITIAVLMLIHGFPKMMMLFSGDPIQFPSVLGMSSELSLALAVMAEVFCSILILVGIATRLAAIPLIVTMLVAVFLIHAADPFALQELGIHYMLAYAILIITGGGKYSVDYYLVRKLNKQTQTAMKVSAGKAGSRQMSLHETETVY